MISIRAVIWPRSRSRAASTGDAARSILMISEPWFLVVSDVLVGEMRQVAEPAALDCPFKDYRTHVQTLGSEPLTRVL